MKLKYIFLVLLSCSTMVSYAALTVSGSRSVSITPVSTTGLETVFVIENAGDASLIYRASSASAAASLKWMRFSSMGGGYAEPIEGATLTGTVSTLRINPGDMGYIVEENGRQTAWWIVDYSKHLPTLTSFSVNPDSDCDRVMFTPQGTFDRINYYSVTGVPSELDREIKLSFTDLQLNSGNGEEIAQEEGDETEDDLDAYWQPFTRTVDFPSVVGTFSVSAPLCNTQFHLSGDRFLEIWGDPVNVSTDTYTTRRVEAKTWAIQSIRENDNEQNPASSGLGGSAPCDITFRAVVSDAAVFTEWQFSATEDFEDVLYRFNETEFTYTFTEYGTTYIRFVCADASGDCTYESETYTVQIGESKLLCPNAFSPQNQDGVNDEWKVSYSSLVSYECHIFNRWGKKLFSSTNPAEGWDGRSGGKFVPSGVYFYVIKAEGADGKKYNLNGDINIVGSKLRPTAEGTEE